MDAQRLQEAVAAEFATSGAVTPPWPDPHPPGTEPLEEEYSRCVHPAKYRILRARAEAWVGALTRFELATVENVEAPAAAWREHPGRDLDTALRLRPHPTGAASLLMAFGSGDEVSDVTVLLGAGEPAVLMTSLPGCGCDACDDGSQELLDELDEAVLAIISGDFLHVATETGTVIATGSEWSASGMSGPQKAGTILADARAGRSPHRVVRGLPWA